MKPTTRSLIKYRGEECLNCGVPLDELDKYCHQCGQLNSTKKLALKDFFSEFFSNVFSYDSRIWLTIKHLLFKPGYVSKQFIKGKRLSYANPFRFFLSVCIVFFLMVQGQELLDEFTDDQIQKAVEKMVDKELADNEQADNEIELGNGIIKIQPDEEKDLKDLTEEDLAKIEKKPVVGKYVAKKIRDEQKKLEKETKSKPVEKKDTVVNGENSIISQLELDSLGSVKRFFTQIDEYQDFHYRTKIADPSTALEKMEHRNTGYNRSMYDKAVLADTITKDPSVLSAIIVPKLPIFLFLFTPFLTLVFWLLYARRSFNYMEHLIFAFNVFTFVFLSCIILLLVQWLSWGYVDLTEFFFWFIGPFYMYKAMRNFYGQRRFKTFIKFLMVSFIFAIGLMIGLSLLLLIGIVLH
ncbi:DUF3667 domain-containing protein [Nonlabens xiamenensis]|uniref:DUF3667 domain-containing protein n=1 Tax=Nonlabens xiamenensis TaxID=2341043 RepID=UPI000F6134BC|nr:DUF3667 domain-containing protein [Nonlabens xiamenensis]